MISAADLQPRASDDPADGERLAARTSHAVVLDAAGVVLQVRFSDADAAAAFAARFTDMRANEAATPDIVHYVATDEAGRSIFWSPGQRGWTWPHAPLPADAVAFLADATAISAAVRSAPGIVSFHAGAVGLGGVAAAIVGDSNAGKTTTTVACGAHGMKIYSDERCMLDRGTVLPFPRTLNIRRDGLRRLRSSGVRCAELLPFAHDTSVSVPISALFGRDAIGAPAPLAAVFLLSGVAASPSIEPASWRDAVPPLRRWMDSATHGIERGAELVRILQDVRCMRVTLGDPDSTARLIFAQLAAIGERRAG